MTKHTVSGAFESQDLGAGGWVLRADSPAATAVYLRGVGPEASLHLSDRRITRIGVEWQALGVVVSLTGASGFRYFKCREAVIHEPQMQLYNALPLLEFDAKARRFWARIFLLMRIPGGRLVLRWIARRRGPRPNSAA